MCVCVCVCVRVFWYTVKFWYIRQNWDKAGECMSMLEGSASPKLPIAYTYSLLHHTAHLNRGQYTSPLHSNLQHLGDLPVLHII